LARPLRNLLKKKQFGWHEEAQSAFDKLKYAMASTPVLALPNFSRQFIVETDACDTGLGAILMQEEKHIAFLSMSLSATNRFLSIYEKELLSLIMTVERWRSYLHRQEFVIKADHRSLAFLYDQTLHSELQHKAMTKLMGFLFTIAYRNGRENKDANALSRIPNLMATQSCCR
jgi:hypothetical protein